ncbi:SDR family NAD(P)-dependent oxidoreductase [Bacillus sp. SCS-153A]|uniref:SDR family NAD(P)-dependent oxidoreductase n=1 Tax=Rossellomorea sedimentorum TaxID=3115294 RepID=UPI003905D5D7
MKKILVIGGTGMLGGAVEHLMKQGNKVTVLSRSHGKYERMLAKHGLEPEEVDFMTADYFDRDALVQVLNAHIKANGPFDQAVIWMRSTAIESFNAVLDILSRHSETVDVFKVNGSAAAHTTLPFEFHQTIIMHHIILGFKIENGESRWLTNDEISEGVISALTSGVPITITGVTDPWDKRPGY